MQKKIFISISLLVISLCCFSQDEEVKEDSLSKFERMSQKGEALFKVIPVPILSYSTEAGQIVGLVKFNLFDLNKHDTISQPSKISEGISISSNGFINSYLSTIFIWDENKYMIQGDIVYQKQPQYIFGTGNDVYFDNPRNIEIARFLFTNDYMYMVMKNLYAGLSVNLANYTEINYDTLDFPNYNEIAGNHPNTNTGFGLTAIWDSRDNRYNTFSGVYGKLATLFYPQFLGNEYIFSSVSADLRYYFVPWKKHVLAFQATTEFKGGEVPFYDLAMLGGEYKMRGYYYGSLRDKVLFDTQIEYRMPIWSLFGAAAWVGTGRVADSYANLTLDGLWLSYGVGLRIRVDTGNNANLRLDWGFGNRGTHGFYINFAEAF